MRPRSALARPLLAAAIPCVALLPVFAAPTPEGAGTEPVRLAGHRAVYDLSLAKSSGPRAIESARGRIVVDFAGDACRGYTMQTRQVTQLASGETGERTSDLRNSTFEAGDGTSLRFRTDTVLNGRPGQTVDGSADSGEDTLKVRLREPKRDQYTAAGPVLFPSRHMRRLIEAARAGETTLAAKVFDGSDDGRKVYDTLAVIGRPGTGAASGTASPPAGAAAEGEAGTGQAGTREAAGAERDAPLRGGGMASMRRWPVTLSYFTAGEGERTPIYTLGFDLYENGVSGALRLDYGSFSIAGNMTRLDLMGADGKARGTADGKPGSECGR